MTRPKVLLTCRWPDAVERRLAVAYDLTTNDRDQPLSAAELSTAMRTFDAICPTVTDDVAADLMAADGLRVKILANYGVGVNHIDVEACRSRGIAVTNTPDVLTDATAELALTLMLMIARRAGEGERQVRAGGWHGWGATRLLGTTLVGKTLGVVGFGRIGQATARMARHGLGMSILYSSRRAAAPGIEAETNARWRTLEDLLAEADVVSLHCPGGADTHHLINAANLRRMKPTAFLINTARGAVVDEDALEAALRSGVIAGAGLDVFSAEPQVPAGFLDLENVVLLPHMGSATIETREAMGDRAADNLDAFFAGERPKDLL
ncbi:MAG: D-glycerate dehydrogenase [Caulobacteraceae bacterium]